MKVFPSTLSFHDRSVVCRKTTGSEFMFVKEPLRKTGQIITIIHVLDIT